MEERGKPPKRRGLSVSASVNPELATTFKLMATEILGAGRESSFGSLMLNTVLECAEVSGLSWEEFKTQLPGYDEAMKRRRVRAAAEHLRATGDLESELAGIFNLPVEEIRAITKEIASRKSKKKAG